MNKFERKYTPAVYKALQSQIREYTVVLRNEGLEAAQRKLSDIDINWKIAPVIKDMYKTVGVFYANQEYGNLRQQIKDRKKGFGFNAEWVAELIRYFTLDLLNKAVLPISATTREQVRQVLEQAANEGWGVDQTVRALQSSDLTLWRARMIVRTEAGKAAFKGRKMAREKIEYETTDEWIAANDHRTRHSHRMVDGDVVDYGKKFKVPIYKGDVQIGVEEMEGPGDPKASAGNIIKCRCTSASRIKYDERGEPILKRGASPVLPQRFFENGGGEKPTGFIPSKTLKEAETWAMSNGIAKKVSYSGIEDIDIVNAINKRLSELVKESGFPYDEIRTKKETKLGGALAKYWMQNEWYKRIDRATGAVLEETNTLNINRAWIDLNGGKLSSLNQYIKQNHERKWLVAENIDDVISHEYGHRLTQTQTGRDGQTNSPLMPDDLSRYASSTLDEALAEIYSAHKKGMKITDKMRELFNKYSKFKI